MSALASLVHAYDRLAARGEAPKFGYSRTEVGFSIRINREGMPVCTPIDYRNPSPNGRKLIRRRLELPTFLGQRTSGIDPNFLWDKSAYVLGVPKLDPTKSEAKQTKDIERAIKAHAEFVDLHRRYLTMTDDEGLVALLRFLDAWKPDQFDGWPEEMKGENIVFELEDDPHRFIHDRPAAQELWSKVLSDQPASDARCLVTGIRSRTLLSHPPIKGVDDAQPSGAFIVSFNLDAFTSYGHKQGDNAPVSEAAAFAYTTALNRFLEKDSGHRIQIGDASTVFWADASDAAQAREAEDIFSGFVDEKVESKKVGVLLEAVRQGKAVSDLKLDLPQGVRFFVLGLSPNAARLSVRFYIEDDFSNIVRHLAQHLSDVLIDPWPFKNPPSARAFLFETCIHTQKQGPNGRTIWERVNDSKPQPVLAGDLMRAILTGSRYPQSLLSAIVQRVSAENGHITGRRIAICKAIVNRAIRFAQRPDEELDSPEFSSREEMIPVALNRENPNAAYRLGRLFALLERMQELALPQLNATIRDRSFGGASTTPAHVFPLLIKLSQHHASAARKDPNTRKLAFWLENQIGEVWSGLEPDLPRALRLDDQARFHAGYYHQRYSKADKAGEKNLTASLEDEAEAEQRDNEE